MAQKIINKSLSPCEHRRRFALISLYEQREAIATYTQGWSKEAVFEWLQLYGEVYPSSVHFFGRQPEDFEPLGPNDHYIFVSRVVSLPFYRWGFHFDEDGELDVHPLSMWQGSQVR